MFGTTKPDKKADEVGVVAEPKFSQAFREMRTRSKEEANEERKKFQASNKPRRERRRARSP